VSGIQQWWEDGERLAIPLGGSERRIFLRRMGAGPSMTLLHGFPSSSHDWAKVAPALAQRHELLAPDFLGFGASEKPADHVYSIGEQADLVEEMWARAGVRSTSIVGHDYAVSVTQELLARHVAGELASEISSVTLLNGGLYPELHRPQPTQTALLDPELGPQIGQMLTEELLLPGLKPTFAEGFDSDGDARDIWRASSREGGQRISHLLIRYMVDREAHGDRWVAAVESTEVPLSFIWGMLDPVSGAHMAERIRARLPQAPFLALEDVSHWPALEAPERVAAAVLSPG